MNHITITFKNNKPRQSFDGYLVEVNVIEDYVIIDNSYNGARHQYKLSDIKNITLI